MDSTKFRKELVKIMPGYKWTVHRGGSVYSDQNYLSATGIQTSGFNRLSTLSVAKIEEKEGEFKYKVRSAGFGKRAPWLSEYTDGTLARALRGLQNHYEIMASNYSAHVRSLRVGRGLT